MSHSSHISCLSGSCLPPHTWQAHMRHSFRSSSLQCLQEGPLFPASQEAGDGISSGRAPPTHPTPHHAHSTEGLYSVCRRARCSLHPGKRGMGSALAGPHPPTLHPITHTARRGFTVFAGGPALPWRWGGVGCQLRHDPHPCTNPQPSTEGLDQNSLLIGFSTMGFPSPGRSILKTSSTKTIRQSLRESPLQENRTVRTTSGPVPPTTPKTRALGHVLSAHEQL